jgi:sugar lactone lactonase YvrE
MVSTSSKILANAHVASAVFVVLVLVSQPAVASPAHIALPGEHLHPESVTSLKDGTLFVGSFADGGILKIAPETIQAQLWLKPGAFETRSILGVLADEVSGTLWACSNDLSGVGVAGPSKVEGSYLKGFDLKTSEGKVSAKLPGENAFCNDIAIGPDGAAYITDSQAPRILRLKPASEELEVFVEDKDKFQPPAGKGGAGLDGIAFDQDGQLYVNKFTEAALFRVDVENGKAGKVTKLETSAPLVLADGLRPTLLAHQFLMIEGRGQLDRVSVEGDKAEIQVLKDGLDGPTGVALSGNTAWVSEGQLSALFEKKAPNLPFKLEAVRIPSQ